MCVETLDTTCTIRQHDSIIPLNPRLFTIYISLQELHDFCKLCKHCTVYCYLFSNHFLLLLFHSTGLSLKSSTEIKYHHIS